MIKGFYSAVSAMMAGLARQNSLVHNVSNLDTPGFKQTMISLQEFLRTTVHSYSESTQTLGVEQRIPVSSSKNTPELIGTLGLGVEAGHETSDFSEGGFGYTGQPFDLAIHGAGFFQVQTPNGERFTRDGRFSKDVDGTLVTVDGYQLLDINGNPITLTEGEIFIGADGQINVSGANVAQIGISSFEDPTMELSRDMGNLFAAEGPPTGTELGTIKQGYLEDSNVNLAQIMTQMVSVGRAYEAAQQMVSVQDELIGRMISSLGKL